MKKLVLEETRDGLKFKITAAKLYHLKGPITLVLRYYLSFPLILLSSSLIGLYLVGELDSSGIGLENEE